MGSLRIVSLSFLAAAVAGGVWFFQSGHDLASVSERVGWLKRSGSAAPAGEPQSPPAVSTSLPVQRRIIEWDEYTGRFDAVETVAVRARVSGYLDEVKFTDGEMVQKGQVLFEIDPRPFERALDQAKAEHEQAKVRVSNAFLDVDRGRPLVQRSVISQKTMDDRENLVRDLEAATKVAESRVKSAELELSFCRITAPIAGRIGRTLLTAGNYISGGGSENANNVLTTIVSQDPIYAYFDVNEANALKYRRLAGQGVSGAAVGAAVGLALPDEDGFRHSARLDFLDNRLDEGTGTLRARARADNRNGLFSPGMFVRVRLQGSPEYSALLLPDEAIGADQTSRYVYVVDQNSMPLRRSVKLGPLIDGLRVVREGVASEDAVIVNGLQRVKPNKKVLAKRTPINVSEAEAAGPAIRMKQP